MKANPAKVCRKCGYDANPATATRCEICGQPLKDSPVPLGNLLARRRPAPPENLVVSFLLLVLVAGIGYLIWRSHAGSTPNSPLPGNSVRIAPELLNREDRLPYAQLYKTMREVQNVPRGVFRYSGTGSFAPLRSQGILDAIAQAHPQFRLRYIEHVNNRPNSATGIDMLLEGTVSFAQTARPLTDAEYGRAKSRGFTLKQIPIAISGIVFYTHPSVDLPGLSFNQLQAIFTGQVTNWQQVGGPNLPVVPFNQDPEASNTASFILEGLSSKRFGPNVRAVYDVTESIRNVAATPGGIGYAPAVVAAGQRTVHFLGLAKGQSKNYVQPYTAEGQVNKEVFQDGTYPLTRRLFVVINEDGYLDELAGWAYTNLLLSTEGQRLIDEAGFVPIREVGP